MSDDGQRRLDAHDFAALFEQSWRTLWTIGVAVLGRREDVDDVLQESAIVALRKLDEFDPSTSFTAWMGQIVRYTALNTGRRRNRRQSMTAGSNGMLERTPADEVPAPSWESAELGAVRADDLGLDDDLTVAMQRLSDSQRICLLLRVVQGHSYREIARTLDMPEGTAMSHVHRAQKVLRNQLDALNRSRHAGDSRR